MSFEPRPGVIQCWTDGSGMATGGPGGWAYVLRTVDKEGEIHVKEGSGRAYEATNNRMELQAVIQGLLAIKRLGSTVEVYSDSEYVCNPFTKGWLKGWQERDWKLGSIPDSLKGVEDAVGCKECGNWAHDPYEESIACARHNPAVWMTKEDFHPKLLRNRDQWQQLATFVTQHTVTFHWIKGHDGIELNERCDKLAGEARREMLKLTYGGTLSVRPKLATQPTITPEPGQVIDVVWGGGFRMTPAIYLREGEVATFIDGRKKVWKLPDGAIFRRRPFAIQPDLLRFADKELRSADA